MSDRIFLVNTSCGAEKYLELYQQHFCPSRWDDPICKNPGSWLSSHTDAEYQDPHHCQSSCKIPKSGCQACTNEHEFSFQCVRNGSLVCIHENLVCDGHPQCQHAEDEDLTLCRDKYFRKKLVEQYATKECQSKMYPEHEDDCHNVQ